MKPTGVNYAPSKPMIGRAPGNAGRPGANRVARKGAVAPGGAASQDKYEGGGGHGYDGIGHGYGGSAYSHIGRSSNPDADADSTLPRANSNSLRPVRDGNIPRPAANGTNARHPTNGVSARPAGDGKNYTTARVMSANPVELILIMFEQFFELIPDIKRNIAKRSPAEAEPDAERAQAIVDELISALDFSQEVSKDLGAIYYYVRNRIMEGNIKFDAAIWDEIETVMRPLYEGFKEAAKQVDAPRTDPLKSKSTQIVLGMTYGQNNLNEVVLNTKAGLKV
jgi:flagellar protein FliS